MRKEIFDWTTTKRGRPKKPRENTFKPDRNFINNAIQDYLKRGGQIKKMTDFSKISEHNFYNEANEFLMGE